MKPCESCGTPLTWLGWFVHNSPFSSRCWEILSARTIAAWRKAAGE